MVLACSASFRGIRASTKPGAIHIRELHVLADVAWLRAVHTSADTDLRAKIALWSLTEKPRGMGRREAETLLRWLEEEG